MNNKIFIYNRHIICNIIIVNTNNDKLSKISGKFKFYDKKLRISK